LPECNFCVAITIAGQSFYGADAGDEADSIRNLMTEKLKDEMRKLFKTDRLIAEEQFRTQHGRSGRRIMREIALVEGTLYNRLLVKRGTE
jgi:hypothetical protein